MAKIEKLGVQLFTVRDYMNGEEAVKSTFERLKSIGYDEVQTAGCPVPFDVMGRLCKEAGLTVCGTHDDFNMMLREPEKAMELHDQLGTKLMGTGGFWSDSKEEIVKYAENVNKLASVIGPKGYKYSYHNHSHEFRKFDERILLEYFADVFDKDAVTFCLDTYWVQHGGGDVRYWIKKLAGRIEVLHLKDMEMTPEGVRITEIGNGNLYWEGIIDEAVNTGVKHFVVEHDVNWIDNDPFKSLEVSANYLRKNFM